MLIKGLQKLTLVDYPKHIAATIFLYGCNFKCSYCHNPELVKSAEAKKIKTYNEQEILDFLKERKNFLDGVCITGGEPTLCKNLPSLLKKIKKLGYAIKLDTNGTNPKMLKKLIKKKLVDYVAIDIKAPLNKYKEITKANANIKSIRESINIIKKMNDYEFRTTIAPDLTKEDVVKIAEIINGAKAFYLQQFIPSKCISKSYSSKKPHSAAELRQMRDSIRTSFEICEIRNQSY